MARKVRILGQQKQSATNQSRQLDTSQLDLFATGHSPAPEQLKTSAWELQNRQSPRPSQMLEAVKNLDVTTDPAYQQKLAKWIQEVYAQRGGGQLVALFSKCYLGNPYQDHHLSLAGNIIEHYQHSEQVPPLFAQARVLAANPAYAYVEIYSDGAVVPVAEDGTAR